MIEFQNGMVGLQLKSLGGDFSQFLEPAHQRRDARSRPPAPYYGLVEGYAPINELPTIAELAQTQSGQVNYEADRHASTIRASPTTRPRPRLFADVARTQFNVDGTGVTIGVLSDSVNQYAGGLADSYKTGDLNPNQSGQRDPGRRRPARTDEGRAMLENIHDIAPGASLAFATGESAATWRSPRTSRPWPARPAPISSSTTSATPTSRCSRTA